MEVGKALLVDPRLTDVDREVGITLLGRAHGFTETEITATYDGLAKTIGYPWWNCRDALKRLAKFGYITRLDPSLPADHPRGVHRQKLRNWLANHTFKSGRLPSIYRVSLNPPHWGDVIDFAAPENGDRERFEALVGVETA